MTAKTYLFPGDRIFSGNYDSDSINIQYLRRPIRAKYIQIIPLKWHVAVGFRFSILGCSNDTAAVSSTIEHEEEVSTVYYTVQELETSSSAISTEGTQQPTEQTTYLPIIFPSEQTTRVTRKPRNPYFPVDTSTTQTSSTRSSSTTSHSSTEVAQQQTTYQPIIFPSEETTRVTRKPRNPYYPAENTTSTSSSISPSEGPTVTDTTTSSSTASFRSKETTSIPPRPNVDTESPIVFPTDGPKTTPGGNRDDCKSCPDLSPPGLCNCASGLYWDGQSCLSLDECPCFLQGIR